MAFTISYIVKLIDQYSKESDKIIAKSIKMESAMRQMSKGTGVASRSLKKLSVNSIVAANSSEKMISAAKDTERRLERVSHATKKTTRANKMAARANKELARSVNEVNRSNQKRIAMQKTIGRGLETSGRFIMTRMVAPMAVASAGAVKMSMDFSKGLANVGTLIPGQTARLQKFKEEVLALSIETGTGANIMTDGLYQVISAIGDTSDTMDVLKLSARAAIAGVAETKDSVNLLTKVSSAYNDTSAGMIQKVSDLSFLAVKLGVTTFPELANSMGKISATAGTMGVSVEELFADTAALTKVMGDTSQAATAMDSVLRGLLQGNTDLDKMMKKLGAKSGKDLIERFGGLQNALVALKGSVNDDEVAFAKLFGRAEAQKGALLLTGSLAKAAASNLDAMKNAIGATDAAYKEQTEGIAKTKHKWEQFKARAFKMAVILGDKLMPAFERLMVVIEPLLDEISSLDKETINSAIAFAKFAVKVAVVSSAIGKLLALSAGIKTFMATMTTDMKGFSSAAGTAGGRVDSLAGKLTKLQKGVALVGAAAMGYSIGQLLQEAVVAPAVDKSERETTDLGNLAVNVERKIDKMNLEQMKGARKQLESAQDKMGLWDWIANNDEFNRTLEDSAKALGKLDASIKIAEMKDRSIGAQVSADQKELEGLGGEIGGRGGIMLPPEPQKMELEIQLKADDGTEIKSVKTKSKNTYATMKVGNNMAS